MKTILYFILFTLVAPIGATAATSLSDDELSQIRFEQKPGTMISSNLVFRDETGKAVRLGDYFGKRPIVLVAGYYGCPMLCSLVLNGAIDGFRGLKRDVGDGFDVIFVSIDPAETPALAAEKKDNYVHRYGRGHADGWHFLTGDTNAIRALADQVGFRFAYDPVARQFAHPSGLMILTPGGQVTRYLDGVTFPSTELDKALQAADRGKITPAASESSLLLCFHYAPLHGKYGRLVMLIVRLGGLATMAVLGAIIFAPRRSLKKSS